MTEAPEALLLDLVEWIAAGPRPYADAIDRWRTSCPRLTVWEDAIDCGFVRRTNTNGRGAMMVATEAGEAFLRRHGRGDGAIVERIRARERV
jgi:hypothetical protein